jgi:type I restriction enzyme S subunit
MNHETLDLLKKRFEAAFDATDGIMKLRELILNLVIQDRLIPQDPNDPPIS